MLHSEEPDIMEWELYRQPHSLGPRHRTHAHSDTWLSCSLLWEVRRKNILRQEERGTRFRDSCFWELDSIPAASYLD